jgi:hypothetical protein
MLTDSAGALAWEITAAMSGQSGRAVRADDLEVLEPVVIRATVDVIEHQRDLPALPELTLPAKLALA